MEAPECSICYEGLDDSSRRPRSLPCGHTICTMCIDMSIERGDRTCPSCRQPHNVTTATKLPVNYALEEVFQKLSVKSSETLRSVNKKTEIRVDVTEKKKGILSETNYFKCTIKNTIEELQKELVMKESMVQYHQAQLEQKLEEVKCLKKDIQEDGKVKNGIEETLTGLEEKMEFLENSVKIVQISKYSSNITDIYEEAKRKFHLNDSQLKEEYFQPRTEKVTRADDGRIGIQYVGGSTMDLPIYISKIVPGKAAEKHGGLKAGDRILSVNGVSLEGKDVENTAKVMRRFSGLITYEVRYSPVGFHHCREKFKTSYPEEFNSHF